MVDLILIYIQILIFRLVDMLTLLLKISPNNERVKSNKFFDYENR